MPADEPDVVDSSLPSRRAVRDLFHAALFEPSAPPLLVLTGGPGVGKTFVWSSLARTLGRKWQFVELDVPPHLSGADLPDRLSQVLGGDRSDPRRWLADWLVEAWLDGRRVVLVVEEAQNLAWDGFEAIRVASNSLGRPNGFAGILLCGQTALARRLAGSALRSLMSRVAVSAHLRPLDDSEAESFLRMSRPDVAWTDFLIRRILVEARGVPRELWRLIGGESLSTPDRADSARPATPPIPVVEAEGPPQSHSAEILTWISDPEPRIATSNPAPASIDWAAILGWPMSAAAGGMLVEDDAVEVGWGLESPQTPSVVLASESVEVRSHRPFEVGAERPVVDPIAAIQAAQERRNDPTAVEPPANPQVEAPSPLRTSATTAVGSRVWVEGQQGFAPYSALFNKPRPPRSRDDR